MRKYKISYKDIGLALPNKKYALVWFVILSLVVLFPYSGDVYSKIMRIPSLSANKLNMLIYKIIVEGISKPFVEEILFRGVLFTLLRSRMSILQALTLQAFIFGVAHIQASSLQVGTAPLGNAAVGGFLAGLGYWGTGSILPGMVVHMLNNCFNQIELTI